MNTKSDIVSAYIIARHMSAASETVDKHTAKYAWLFCLTSLTRLLHIPHYANKLLGNGDVIWQIVMDKGDFVTDLCLLMHRVSH